jgi:hypothetical protein
MSKLPVGSIRTKTKVQGPFNVSFKVDGRTVVVEDVSNAVLSDGVLIMEYGRDQNWATRAFSGDIDHRSLRLWRSDRSIR